MDKEYYYALLLPEIIRYAKINSLISTFPDEYRAAVFAVWYVQNPIDAPNRDSICNFDTADKTETAESLPGVRFTAHTHPAEPLVPSPDDSFFYDRAGNPHGSGKRIFHFIIDGYTCRKAEEPDDDEK